MVNCKKILVLVGWLMCSLSVGAQATLSRVWVADNGNGTYRNPIIHADYSDPDVCRAGEDYYMTASSFNCIPGLPILHSRDLVNWTIIGHALPRQTPADFFAKAQHGKGVWAPAIRFHKGEFYIYWGDPDFGIYMTKTSNPRRDWITPILVKSGRGMIDPCPLWDDDGRVYMSYAWAGSRSGINSIITLVELNAEGTAAVSDPVMVFDGNDGVNHTVEGTKMYKRGGYYYIFSPAGGVATGWQLAMRSKNIYGPYEPKIVMAQGKTDINGPHQGGLVDTPSGQEWFLHFQDKGAYGRIIHLNPVEWVDGWPVIGVDTDGDGCGEPVSVFRKPDVGRSYPAATPAESDEFDSGILGAQWQWHANYDETFGFTSRYGFMRVYAHFLSARFVNFWEVPNLFMQKFPAEEFTVTAKLGFRSKTDGESTGLIVMGWDYCRVGFRREGDKMVLEQSVCKDAENGAAEERQTFAELPMTITPSGAIRLYSGDFYLRIEVSKGGVCRFYYSADDRKYTEFGKPFIARQGKWIGAKVGMFCVNPEQNGNRGWVDVDWFRVDK